MRRNKLIGIIGILFLAAILVIAIWIWKQVEDESETEAITELVTEMESTETLTENISTELVTEPQEDLTETEVQEVPKKPKLESVEYPKEQTVSLGMSQEEIEASVLDVRKRWNADSDAIDKGQYTVYKYDDGSVAYISDDQLMRLETSMQYEGKNYSATYTYDITGELLFAYLEAKDAHRLYFLHNQLYRWRYSENAKKPDNATNYDNRDDLAEFNALEKLCLEDSQYKYEMVMYWDI